MYQSFLRRNWERILGSPCPSQMQVAVISSCLDDFGNNLALIFIEDESAPRYVMKLARAEQYGFKLEREFAALQEVGADNRLRQVVPTAFYLGDLAGRTFFVQEGIDGTSLSRLVREQGLTRANRELLESAVDLLVDLNSTAAQDERRLDAGDDASLRLSARENRVLGERLSEILQESSTYRLHGDYWPLNILVRQKRIVGIVDWEYYVPVSPLPSDIVWFLVNLGYVVGQAELGDVSLEASFEWAFYQRGKCGELLHDLWRRYSGAMGLDEQIFLPLLETSLSWMATREHRVYGRHLKMDAACLKMLRHTLKHEGDLCVG